MLQTAIAPTAASRIAPPLGKSHDFKNAHGPVQSDRHHIAYLDAVTRRRLAHPVDAHVTGFHERGRAGAGLDQARVPQPFVETLALHATPTREDRALILASGAELFLERRKFGKWRIRIDRAVTIARACTCRVLPMRGTALPPASVAVASRAVAVLVAPGFAPLVAIAELASVPLFAASLAFKTFSRPTAPLLTHISRRRAIGRCSLWSGLIRVRLARIVMTVAAPVPVPLALGAFASRGFPGDSSRCARGRTLVAAMPLALMSRPPLVGPAAGTPNLDQFRLGGRCRGDGR